MKYEMKVVCITI